ncbi:hypothetical protein ACEWY4_022560 [Coilia grayii]|uniref:FH2 domain-containing protein n=1 Tax=Coilia grayii TaxID=363190 RepID=A0ABD1J6A5_9TELE
MEINPGSHTDLAPVSFLDKFATIFTRADGAQADVAEERVLTFFRTLSEREPRVRNVDDPTKTVGWSDESGTKEGLKVELKKAHAAIGPNEDTKTISKEAEEGRGDFFSSDGFSTRPGQSKNHPNPSTKLLPQMCSEMSDCPELTNKKTTGGVENKLDSSRVQPSKSQNTVGDEPLDLKLAPQKPHEHHEDQVETNDSAPLCAEVREEFVSVSGGVKDAEELGEVTHTRAAGQTSLNMDSRSQSADQSEPINSKQDESTGANCDKLAGSSPEQHMFMSTYHQGAKEADIAHNEGRSKDHQNGHVVDESIAHVAENIDNYTTRPVIDVYTDVRSKEDTCIGSLAIPDIPAPGSTDVSTCASDVTGDLCPTTEWTGAPSSQTRTALITITMVGESSIAQTGNRPDGDSSVASHAEGADVNPGADRDSAQSGPGNSPPSEQENDNSEGGKQEEGKEEMIKDKKRETDGKTVECPPFTAGAPGSPSTAVPSSPHPAPRDKPVPLQSLFSGLLKRGSTDGEKEATVNTCSAADQKTKPIRSSLFTEQSPPRVSPTKAPPEQKGGFLEQLSLLLKLESNKMEHKTEEERKQQEQQVSQPHGEGGEGEHKGAEEEEKNVEEEGKEKEEEGKGEEGQNVEEIEVVPAINPAEETKKPTSTESAFEAFKAFFTPKPIKKPTTDRGDLEAVKRKIRNDKEKLRAIFERKTDSSNLKSEGSPAENEERTPRRLQAIWPPPKPKDEVGLKYTEAEHQSALLQLKRECKEEVEKLQADFERQLFRIHVENDETVSRLEVALVNLQRDTGRHGNLRDACVSTEDDLSLKTFRTVCVQTDRDTFIKPDELEESRTVNQNSNHSIPKKLNLTSLNLGLAGKAEQTVAQKLPPPPPPTPPPLPLQSGSSTLSSSPVSPGDSILTTTPVPLLPGSPTASSGSQVPDRPSIPPPPPPPLPSCGPPPAPPPPPPPDGGHLPPPPPPAAGFTLTSSLDTHPRKPALEPSCPMKPLYWTRIQIHNTNDDTLWSSLEEPHIVDPHEFEDLFAKALLATKRKPLSEAYERRNKARKIIKLLDSKRSQAVGIFISSLHLEMKDIKQAVLTVDNSVVDLDTIEALYENRAQPGELEQLKKYYETSDEENIKLLDKPEQFLYELSQIPDFSGRAQCLIFQSVFTDSIASIQRKVEIVSRVCKGLLERASVREVVGLVLSLGNYMNGGSRVRGQADGFGLEILPKLKDVKSRDNRISLVDYIVSYYLRNLDANAGTDKSVFPLPEPQDVFLAAQVKFEDLFKDLRKLGKDLLACEEDVQRVCTSSSEEHIHPFKEKMEGFISNGKHTRC